ncbi:MAG TPA: APH(3') family aminoglycoside O-phosphotransferase [Dictyobacter sp.]|jgi:aminoglycoside phosphotransferase|nr:APH(3') family aminoglycoside O-phosphotransferase [Dictyobacter sp.]
MREDHQTNAWLQRLPSAIKQQLPTGEWQAIAVGHSDVTIFHICDTYLKIFARTPFLPLKDEMDRLQWLQQRLPVPRVLHYCVDECYEYLLLSAIAGEMACDPGFVHDMPRLVRTLAQGLRQIHIVDIHDCPFDGRIAQKIARSQQRRTFTAGTHIHSARMQKNMQQLYAHLWSQRPSEDQCVWTHGDYCLPNILINTERMVVSGFIDWSSGGIADPYQDLALACRSLAFNFGPEWIPLFLQEYGITEPDQARIAFYQALDELA